MELTHIHTERQTDITTYRLNRPRSRFLDNHGMLSFDMVGFVVVWFEVSGFIFKYLLFGLKILLLKST